MAIVLGIDPGSRITGYGVIDCQGNRLRYLACGRIRTSGERQGPRLQQIYAGLDAIIREFQPGEAAIEEVFMGRNPSSALKLGQARGSAMVACLNHELPLEEYSARQVKLAVVGSGAAQKSQIQHMVRALLNISDNIAEDAADALAVAICHANTQASLVRMAGARTFSRRRLR